MITLQGKKVKLRALEPEDLDFLFKIENNTKFWEVSSTQVPFSKYMLKKYLENAHQDIYEAKQLRMVIEEISNNKTVGLIDIFDFNPKHKRAGIGIVISEPYQKEGFASDSLSLLISYCFEVLDLHQLFANITSNNKHSIKLFTSNGFKKCGEKKDWLFTNGEYKNELTFQLIHE
jgi:diamine N-acetyltransferase